MNTQAIKNAIYAEMANGDKTLLEAKLAVIREFSERVEVATEELRRGSINLSNGKTLYDPYNILDTSN